MVFQVESVKETQNSTITLQVKQGKLLLSKAIVQGKWLPEFIQDELKKLE
jgi:hypothetical protein